MVRNVNINIDLCFRLSCELVGWLTILGFPVNLSGDRLLPNTKRWKLSTAHVVGEGKSGSWGGALTKGEVRECEITKICSSTVISWSCVWRKRKITELFPDTTFYLIRKLALRINKIKDKVLLTNHIVLYTSLTYVKLYQNILQLGCKQL